MLTRGKFSQRPQNVFNLLDAVACKHDLNLFWRQTLQMVGKEVKHRGERRHTFLVDPLHGEELVVVHGAHVLHLPVQTLV